MADFEFPPLFVETWRQTLDALRHYSRALSSIRRALAPAQKHWAHVSLYVNARGLTTTPIPHQSDLFEIALDLTAHRVSMTHSRGRAAAWRLQGQAPSQFWRELNRGLAAWDIQHDAAMPGYPDAVPLYDARAVERYWRVLSQVDLIMKQFRGALRAETGPVQFWSHHFDLAMLWFSGRKVPGQDPADEEKVDEQMNFGFSIGDELIPAPYFYVTAYPQPENFIGSPLPQGASWHTQGWNGAVLHYKTLSASRTPVELLLDFWRTTHERGSKLMRK